MPGLSYFETKCEDAKLCIVCSRSWASQRKDCVEQNLATNISLANEKCVFTREPASGTVGQLTTQVRTNDRETLLVRFVLPTVSANWTPRCTCSLSWAAHIYVKLKFQFRSRVCNISFEELDACIELVKFHPKKIGASVYLVISSHKSSLSTFVSSQKGAVVL